MAYTFTIVPASELSVLLKRAESAVSEAGGAFHGNEESGSFLGSTPLGFIKAEYCCIQENKIQITIVEKPFLVPYSVIESKMREYFC